MCELWCVAQRHGIRGLAFTELVEGLLVQRRIVSDRGEIVAQPLFVFDELATLLFQLVEFGVLPSERLPPRSELSKRFFDWGFELVRCNEHAEAIVGELQKPDRLFERAIQRHDDIILFVVVKRHWDAVGIGSELDM